MFEKEAEEYAEKHAFRVPYDGSDKFYDDKDYECSKEGFQKGAVFGYKLAHKEMDYLNKHWGSEEKRKANEWHYVKDGLPEELHDVLCFVIHNEHRYVLQGYLREGRWVLSPLGTYLNNDDVIAWKEIVLPKESE